MSVVVLASGGLDSTLLSVLATEAGQQVHPLFVDYGQLAAEREWAACRRVFKRHKLPKPRRMALRGYGALVRSGLTDRGRMLVDEAFTPGRNGLLLMVASSYAVGVGARAVAIGLLDEAISLFPDQRRSFLTQMESALNECLGIHVAIVAPLMHFRKAHIVQLASSRSIVGTYSCHAGHARPCGRCISCTELMDARRG